MVETKTFPTAAVLSTVTGILVSDIGGVYEVLNWMTGESIFTHQIPRVSKEAAVVIIAAQPDIALAVEEAKKVTPENWSKWLDVWIERYGVGIEVPKMTAEQHERIDAISELAEKIHPDKIIPVVLP